MQHPYIPKLVKIKGSQLETQDIKTISFVPFGVSEFLPGQFLEVSCFGTGEVPISISSSPYERAGRIKGKVGSITQIPILTMPGDDITHPIVDLTGYITEGQILLSRALYQKGLFPPIDVLPNLSRLMNQGIGKDKTREDHRELANQLYASYSRGVDLRRLRDIVGEEGLSELDKKYLKFSDTFEEAFVGQFDNDRSIEESLSLGYKILRLLPKEELRRLSRKFIEIYLEQLKDWGSFAR